MLWLKLLQGGCRWDKGDLGPQERAFLLLLVFRLSTNKRSESCVVGLVC